MIDDNDLELLQEFVVESSEHLSSVENELAALYGLDGDLEIVNRIFRAVHSVKGAAGFFGLTKINRLSHTMESLLMKIRDGERNYDNLTLDILVKCNDRLVRMLEKIETSEEENIDNPVAMLQAILDNNYTTNETLPAFLARLGFSDADQVEKSPSPSEEKLEKLHEEFTDAYETASASENEISVYIPREADLNEINRFGHFLYKLTVPFSVFENTINMEEIIGEWKKLGKIYELEINPKKTPEGNKTPEEKVLLTGFLSTVLKPDIISDGLEIPEDCVEMIDTGKKTPLAPLKDSSPVIKVQNTKPTSVRPGMVSSRAGGGLTQIIDSAMNEVETPAKIKSEQKRTVSEETVRVKTSLLDSLMQMAGELVLARNRLMRIMKNNDEQFEGLGTVLHQVDSVTSGIQSQIMKTRLQPIGNLFKKFPRVIRELELKLSKEVDLIIKGKEVELDKTIIENLSDILTHIIRNSMDHGIEDPDYRETAGKPRKGTIILSAYYEGGMVNIDVEDNGRGIDKNKIAEKALLKGLITRDELEITSDREILNLLFAPGFSTAEKVSDVSGRGVGMDVVRTNIEKLGGNVEINSEFGSGTMINLKLPLTLAIIPSLIFEVSGFTFAIHQVALEEALRIKSGDLKVKIEKINHNLVLRHRDSLLPLVNLSDVLKINKLFIHPDSGTPSNDRRKSIIDTRDEETSERRKDTSTYHRVLVLRAGRYRYGLIVDRILDNEEIVIKPLAKLVKTSPAFSGATILGDGTIAIILDALGIIQQSRIKFHEIEQLEIKDETESENELGEMQSLFFFDNGSKEKFAVPLNLVKRIEKVDSSMLKIVGDKEYIATSGNKFLPILRLENLLDVGHGENTDESFYIIHPKLVKKPVCIVARNIVDINEVRIQLDRETIKMDGLVGSALINGDITLLLNIYRLFEMFDPDSFKSIQELHDGIEPSKIRILLAEDTPFFRMIEKDYLEHEGFHVISAINGVEALEKLDDEGPFDMVVTDIIMPHMDGFTLFENIKKNDRYKDIPVMAVTSMDDDKSKEKGEKMGFDAFEMKLDKEKLLSTVYHLLARKGGYNGQY
ncbi:MAG: chemotaxis protein CheW [Deltaproteobacteria bacterium]|nr:chemotaxis protein CheW [Deltaproteobacteria bacterium]